MLLGVCMLLRVPVTTIYQGSKYSKKVTDPLSVKLISNAFIFPHEDGRPTETCSG
jgi:hypothetical protein